MQQAGSHWDIEPHLGSSGHPCVSGDCELAAGVWGARRWIFSLICRGKRISLPRYCCGVLNSSTEIITKFWKFLWHALHCWRGCVHISVRAEGFVKDPDTSKDLTAEKRGCSLNYAEKWLFNVSLHISSCCMAKKLSICVTKKKGAWPQATI